MNQHLYGYRGLGDEHEPGTVPAATSQAEIEASYRVGLQVGVPIVTGLVGVGLGLVLGYFVFRK